MDQFDEVLEDDQEDGDLCRDCLEEYEGQIDKEFQQEISGKSEGYSMTGLIFSLVIPFILIPFIWGLILLINYCIHDINIERNRELIVWEISNFPRFFSMFWNVSK